MMTTIWRDIRQGFRRLQRNPGFTTAALLTLVVGIGMNSAMFSVVNAVLLRPLPYEQAEELYLLWGRYPLLGYNQLPASEPEILDFQKQGGDLFESLAAYTDLQVTLNSSDDPLKLRAAETTSELFQVLRQRAAHGRLLLPEDDDPGAGRVVVLGYELWQNRFGGESDVVGSRLDLEGEPYEVVGIAQPGFSFPERSELWLPLVIDPGSMRPRSEHYLRVLGRLQSGLTRTQANEEAKAIAYRFQQLDPGTYPPISKYSLWLVPLREQIVGQVRSAFLVLLATVAFVLLIAITNVTNLLLIRSQAQERETAVRRAFGISPGGLLRLFFVECLLLTGGGGLLGLLAAHWSVKLLVALNRDNIPRATDIGIDLRVLLFTLALVLVTGTILALLMTWRARRIDLQEALKEGAGHATAGASHQTTRSLLLITEVAMALVLLIGAGLMLNSLGNLRQSNVGFRAEGLLTTRLALQEQRYPEDAQIAAFYDRLASALNTAPELDSVALINRAPFGEPALETTFAIEGKPFSHDTGELPPSASILSVSPDYFRTMGIPLRDGRTFGFGDHRDATRVAIVDEITVRRYFGEDDPINRRLKLGSHQSGMDWITIVGIVGEIKDSRVDTESDAHIYLPYPQEPDPEMAVLVRSNADVATQVSALRRIVRAEDSTVPLFETRTMESRIAGSMATERLATALLSLFAAIALLLAAIGLYGVIAYNVQLRRTEIGIRMAIGAQRAQIFRAIVLQGLTLTLIGIGIGVAASLGLSQLLANLLFGVSAQDPMTFLGAAVLLLAVSGAASFLPAQRATRVQPNVVLRSE